MEPTRRNTREIPQKKKSLGIIPNPNRNENATTSQSTIAAYFSNHPLASRLVTPSYALSDVLLNQLLTGLSKSPKVVPELTKKEILGRLKWNMFSESKDAAYKLRTARNSQTMSAKKPKKKLLSGTERKKLKLFDAKVVVRQKSAYETYLPLHELWKQYFAKLFAGPQKEPELKIVKADLHGCLIKVIQSKTPSLVNLSGIIVKETEKTFQIISRGCGKVKTLPKESCVFLFEFDSDDSHYRVALHGQHFQTRSHERSTKKWTQKPSVLL